MAKKQNIKFIEVSKDHLLSLFKKIDKAVEEYQEEAYQYGKEGKPIAPRTMIAHLHVIKVEISNIKTKIMR